MVRGSDVVFVCSHAVTSDHRFFETATTLGLSQAEALFRFLSEHFDQLAIHERPISGLVVLQTRSKMGSNSSRSSHVKRQGHPQSFTFDGPEWIDTCKSFACGQHCTIPIPIPSVGTSLDGCWMRLAAVLCLLVATLPSARGICIFQLARHFRHSMLMLAVFTSCSLCTPSR